ncbi:hypothetical protein [Caloranaerobacter azorensis]|uniref:hypothetical protein n=1 Tax=Caloranaerobacter azorensis TaxID=116090 RepID=UPI0012E0AB1A|nr:hypothetical protein [Caloranaerobacter azorensis]
MVTLKDSDNKVTSVLVIYDITSEQTEIIPIGKGVKSFIGWDYKGNSFYGTDYLMIMTQ